MLWRTAILLMMVPVIAQASSIGGAFSDPAFGVGLGGAAFYIQPVSDPLYAAAGSDPVLDLKLAENGDFTDAISGNDLVTFSRSAASSPGTYVGSDGLIKTAAVNSVLYSSNFSVAPWSSVPSTGTITHGHPDPFGGNGATKLVRSLGQTSWMYVAQGFGSTKTGLFSLYVKDAGYGRATPKNSSSNDGFIFSTKTFQGAAYAGWDYEELTGGWFRLYGPGVSTAFLCGISPNGDVGDGVSGVYMFGAQLQENETVLSPYIETTSQSLAAPRFDYDPVSLKPLGLLVEEARTNRNPYSQDFSTWTILSGVTDTPNAGTSPDGQNNATRITSSAAQTSFSSNNRIYYGSLSPVDSLKSIFVKADTHDQVAMRHSGSNNQGVYFDLTAGTATPYGASSPTVYGMKQYSDGWWRVWIRTNDYLMLSVYNAIGSVYVWGAQEEELVDTATSYIPTSGTSLSRAADLASIVGADFTSWYNASEGTTYVQYEVDDKPAGSRKNSHSFYTLPVTRVMESGWRSAGGSADYGFAIVNTRVITSTQDPAANTFFKEATAYDPGNYAYAIDGVADTSSSATVPGTADAFYLGASQTQFIINGHIKRLTYWNTRLPDANLGAITQ